MPPACPVDRYVPRYSKTASPLDKCHRLARWIVTFLATAANAKPPQNATGLPGGSLRSLLQQANAKPPQNATGLPGGSLRSLLHARRPSPPHKCHRLARWIVTFLATAGQRQASHKCHRLARWIVTFLATARRHRLSTNATGLPGGSLRSLLQQAGIGSLQMPPACPVDRYVPCYRGPRAFQHSGHSTLIIHPQPVIASTISGGSRDHALGFSRFLVPLGSRDLLFIPLPSAVESQSAPIHPGTSPRRRTGSAPSVTCASASRTRTRAGQRH